MGIIAPLISRSFWGRQNPALMWEGLTNCYLDCVILVNPTGLCGCNSPGSRLKREHSVSGLSLLMMACPVGYLRKRLAMKIIQVLSTFLLTRTGCFFLTYGTMQCELHWTDRHTDCSEDGYLHPSHPPTAMRTRWYHSAAQKQRSFLVFKKEYFWINLSSFLFNFLVKLSL